MADDWMLAFAGPEGADAARFDRAAHLRGDDGWTASARITPVWRGKVLCRDAGGLAWLPPDHPALDGGGPSVFLGTLDGQPVGTRDISGWTPPNLAETELFIDPSEQRHPAIEDARFVDLRASIASFDAADGALAAISRAIMRARRGALLVMTGVVMVSLQMPGHPRWMAVAARLASQ